jgi:Flp pilus assembly protein TadD
MSRKNRSAASAAAQHRRAESLAGAESRCRAVLDEHPDNVDAMQELAVLCHQQGRSEEALALFRRAIALEIPTAVSRISSSADCWSNGAIC